MATDVTVAQGQNVHMIQAALDLLPVERVVTLNEIADLWRTPLRASDFRCGISEEDVVMCAEKFHLYEAEGYECFLVPVLGLSLVQQYDRFPDCFYKNGFWWKDTRHAKIGRSSAAPHFLLFVHDPAAGERGKPIPVANLAEALISLRKLRKVRPLFDFYHHGPITSKGKGHVYAGDLDCAGGLIFFSALPKEAFPRYNKPLKLFSSP